MNALGPQLTIGRFADLTMLSPKALRLYDQRGLLPPARVDAETGYRFYQAEQVATGRLIALLRSASVPLDVIQAIIDEQDPIIRVRLIAQHAESRKRKEVTVNALLAQAISQISDLHSDHIDVVVLPNTLVMSLMGYPTLATIDEVVGTMINRLSRYAEAQQVASNDAPFGIFHRMVSDEMSGPIEVCMPIRDMVVVNEDIRSYRLTGGEAAVVTVEGEESFAPRILVAYDRIAGWTDTQGYERVGPPREIWHDRRGASGSRMTIAWPFVPARR